jgi:hypothetical protein
MEMLRFGNVSFEVDRALLRDSNGAEVALRPKSLAHLDGGSHRKLTKAKMVCVLEASIAAAGFEYREVLSADDCPPGFSIIIASDAMLLNEIMPPRLRQKLLTPFITKLADTAADEAWEFIRAEYIVEETCRRIMSLYFDQVLERPDLAQACRKTETLEEVKKVCWSVVETVDGNWPGTASSHAAIACNYARDGIAGQAITEVADALYLACGRSRKRQEKYFPIAAQILDEAIMLGARA